MKKYVLGLIVVCISMLLQGCQAQETRVIFKLDEDSVCEAEFKMAMEKERTNVILYFSEKYGETQFDGTFWDKSYGENKEKPIDILKDRAVEEITYNHSVLLIGKEEQIISSMSYEDILEMYANENESRQENLESGEVIYGVTAFEFRDYYDWLISNYKMQLRNHFIGEVTEQEILQYYEREKENIALIPSVLTCRQYFIPKENEQEQAFQTANRILEEINKGNSFEAPGKEFGVEATWETYDLATSRGMSVMQPQLWDALMTMELKELLLVEETDGYYILLLDDIEEEQYEPVEKVANKIASILAQEQLDGLLEQKCAELEINKTKYFDIVVLDDMEDDRGKND